MIYLQTLNNLGHHERWWTLHIYIQSICWSHYIFPTKGHFRHEPKAMTTLLVRPLDSHPKCISPTWSAIICVKPTSWRWAWCNANSSRPWNVISGLLWRNPCKLFIHDNFFGPVDLHLLVRSELGQSRSFRPMRKLGMQWSQTFSLVCEVALTHQRHDAPPYYCIVVDPLN